MVHFHLLLYCIIMFFLKQKLHWVTLVILHWRKNRICPKFAWCKYVANMKFAQLCNQCKGGDGQIRAKTSKFGHHHTCTGCKALQSSYLQHICKFYANLFFYPVLQLSGWVNYCPNSCVHVYKIILTKTKTLHL